MFDRGPSFHARLLCSAAVVSMVAVAGPAAAQERSRINIEPQPLVSALNAFGVQTGQPVISTPELTGAKTSPGVRDAEDPAFALAQLLSGTGLSYRCSGDTYLIVKGPQAGPAPSRCIVQSGAGGSEGASGTVEALIVTAQKREEDIQDVPIAMSAFSQEDLTRSQIAGGPDLMNQVPNMTFTKTNFSGYSIQIRGIGTQAISATTDPAVAVAFNNTPFVRNRFFEQEFYDLQRIEVLRGPQGTLYGRNATAGVVNIISAKPKFAFEAKASGDLGNYGNQRLEGMINIPLVEDAVALRLAGAWTKRDGYVMNQLSGTPIDGRDLWSTRVSLRFAPSDAPFDINLLWEHFEEADDRLRSGKQLCKKHAPNNVAGVALNTTGGGGGIVSETGTYSQGCEAVSLYSPDAFQTPNGWALPYYHGLNGLGFPSADPKIDPYRSTTQSRDLRVIESTVNPDYQANSNIFEIQANFDLTDDLTLTSETSYSTDELFSLQDLNRFNTAPGAFAPDHLRRLQGAYPNYHPLNNGVFCDPQLGCSDRLVLVDLSTANSTQFSQELRLGSDFDGKFNFSLGANFLRYDTVDKYYVFANSITLSALTSAFWGDIDNATGEPTPYIPNVTDNRDCNRGANPWLPPDPSGVLQVPAAGACLYIDPNPIGSLNDQGNNYFLSKNPYKLVSYAMFGEIYYQLTDNLKLTGGLRFTVDHKSAPRLPSMLLAAYQASTPTRTQAPVIGLSVDKIVQQEWREPTGRLAIDWKPELSFTDETLLYASYAHGYKAGGANPPPTAVITYGEVAAEGRLDNFAIFPPTFDPEFIDAFELGAKNTLLDGTLTLNTAAFYYDYKNYQVSEIVERSALNRNFDATVWGIELEADWRPIDNLKLSFKGGYEKTRIADGEQAIDLMDRTAGDPDWVVVKPFPASPSNCVIPTWLATWHNQIFTGVDAWGICTPIINGMDPVTWLPYVANPTLTSDVSGNSPTSLLTLTGFPNNYWLNYPGYDPATNNNSTGIYKQLGGNELPNAPQYTATVSADYTVPLRGDWLVALHTDLHWQSKSYWRVFNDLEYDKLEGFYTMNLAAVFSNEAAGWNVMAYVKNVFDEAALTGAFLFSDDTGLTTNIFLTEPRLYGLRVTKAWSGGSLLGGFGARHEGPYPFTLELGGQAQRHDAPYQTLAPDFASVFPGQLAPLGAQNEDLDWGDGREVKLTYRPGGGAWRFSLGGRFDETNGSAKLVKSAESEDQACAATPGTCDPVTGSLTAFHRAIYTDTTVRSEEEHRVIDFKIERDVGLGLIDQAGARSKVGLGVRYAKLDSQTRALILGIPDWDLAPYSFVLFPVFQIYESQHTHYEAEITADRGFEGVGPVLSWDASLALLGDDGVGHLDVDVAVSGGVLFGKQKTGVVGSEVAEYFSLSANSNVFNDPDTITTTPIDFNRSESVTVPVLDLSLGLSYKIDRMMIGAGYRWERYFNALDGGYDEAEDADRTIDGPYFKLSVGFGG